MWGWHLLWVVADLTPCVGERRWRKTGRSTHRSTRVVHHCCTRAGHHLVHTLHTSSTEWWSRPPLQHDREPQCERRTAQDRRGSVTVGMATNSGCTFSLPSLVWLGLIHPSTTISCCFCGPAHSREETRRSALSSQCILNLTVPSRPYSGRTPAHSLPLQHIFLGWLVTTPSPSESWC
jgi:hypothetical protein